MKMHVEIQMKDPGVRYHCEEVFNFYFADEGKATIYQIIEVGGIRRTFERSQVARCKVWME